ncbi:hypothetical protein PMZ80_008107 [Knufia obscura]|uniref:Uncharacterized protein n=1 Tax=Knufia obscura TaxID=1635080 RepID=A0ABR0RHK2_9EURO|nr:hypothetical protein PMZ80_008107 [Knufia obscura]
MHSLFMSDEFVVAESSPEDMKIASIAWGFQLGFALLTAAKAGGQTLCIWRRTGRISGYTFMVWLEIIVNSVLGVLSWLYMDGIIPPSFAYFMVAVTLWCIELHLLIQIIVNRIALLITSRRRITIIKWGSCAIILVLNIGVYCIWIPARLQVTQTYINVNNVFDRCEKVVYLLLDALLNFYFCYLVKTKLVDTGMTKYMPLYRFNMSIVFVSLSMDVLLIGK